MGPARVTFSAGHFLLSMQSEGFTWFEFRDPSGLVVDVAGNPAPSAAVDSSSVGHGVQSPDGTVLTYVSHRHHGLPRVEVYDPDGHRPIASIPAAAGTDDVMWLDFDGEHVAVSRSGEHATEDRPALLIDLSARKAEELDVAGTVRLPDR